MNKRKQYNQMKQIKRKLKTKTKEKTERKKNKMTILARTNKIFNQKFKNTKKKALNKIMKKYKI